jgi:hypothetical protein
MPPHMNGKPARNAALMGEYMQEPCHSAAFVDFQQVIPV